VSDDDDPKTPIDQALDVFVFLPLGFVLEFPRSIPRYIERGRQQLDAVKRIGRETMPAGSSPADQFDRLQAQTRNTLRALGVVSSNGAASRTTGFATSTSSPSPPTSPSATRASSASAGHAEDAATDTDTDRPSASVTHIVRTDEPGIDAATLAIPDYDSLSASQVVPRLDSLSLDELELVRQYENAKRGRKTILSKIAQLQAD